MKKFIASLFVICICQLNAFAQTASDKVAAANQEIKSNLAAKLNVSEEKAEKIIAIETEFRSSLLEASKLPNTTLAQQKEKEKKIGAAHVVRREKLMQLPLTGREMEDAIEISEAAGKKHKL